MEIIFIGSVFFFSDNLESFLFIGSSVPSAFFWQFSVIYWDSFLLALYFLTFSDISQILINYFNSFWLALSTLQSYCQACSQHVSPIHTYSIKFVCAPSTFLFETSLNFKNNKMSIRAVILKVYLLNSLWIRSLTVNYLLSKWCYSIFYLHLMSFNMTFLTIKSTCANINWSTKQKVINITARIDITFNFILCTVSVLTTGSLKPWQWHIWLHSLV